MEKEPQDVREGAIYLEESLYKQAKLCSPGM